ncbi:mucin-19-like isoform X2 [Triticum dicoccoides]|uniref:mucin-19-like isoform X2 n=1 Tax=Triticum dicoccoides TaxID=85692 RepID=UPI00188E7D3B|nr:mucin-19-like isoform X2 [Triticum dicoccoides]
MSDDPGSPLPWQGSASGNRCGTPTGGATDSERRDTNWARLSRPTSTAATSFTLAPASFRLSDPRGHRWMATGSTCGRGAARSWPATRMTGRTPATCTAATSPPRAGLVLAGSWGGSSTWCSAAAATTAASGSSSSSAQGSWTGRFAASGRQTMAMTLCPARVLTPSRPAPLAPAAARCALRDAAVEGSSRSYGCQQTSLCRWQCINQIGWRTSHNRRRLA